MSIHSSPPIFLGTPLPNLNVYSYPWLQIELYLCLLTYVFTNVINRQAPNHMSFDEDTRQLTLLNLCCGGGIVPRLDHGSGTKEYVKYYFLCSEEVLDRKRRDPDPVLYVFYSELLERHSLSVLCEVLLYFVFLFLFVRSVWCYSSHAVSLCPRLTC